jgi:hypothetical protein
LGGARSDRVADVIERTRYSARATTRITNDEVRPVFLFAAANSSKELVHRERRFRPFGGGDDSERHVARRVARDEKTPHHSAG